MRGEHEMRRLMVGDYEGGMSLIRTRVLMSVGFFVDLFRHGHHLLFELQHIVLAFLDLRLQIHHELIHRVLVRHDVIAVFLSSPILAL